jgi:hypothetical protein
MAFQFVKSSSSAHEVEMDIALTLPLDQDGFLRRECSKCEQQFKWHDGPANEDVETEPAPPAYYCPFCGEPAGEDSWWTQEQIAFIEGTAEPAMMRECERERKDTLGSSSSRRSGIRFEFKGGDIPAVPAALTEPDDMQIIASPCHSYEPIKVPDDATGPFHCLICGQKFAV